MLTATEDYRLGALGGAAGGYGRGSARLRRRVSQIVLYILLIIGALSTHPTSDSIFANRMPAVLWILAVGSFWTFAYRVYHTWSELNRIGADATAQTVSETSQTQAAAPRRADAHGAPAPPCDASNTDAGRLDAPDIARRVPASR